MVKWVDVSFDADAQHALLAKQSEDLSNALSKCDQLEGEIARLTARIRELEAFEERSNRVRGSDGENTNRRRDALARLMHNQGLTQTAFARRLGMKNANFIVNFMSGRSHSLSQDTIELILATFPTVSFEELVGWA